MVDATLKSYEKATIGGGCFWCVEAMFQKVPGVEKIVSGFAGGHLENPSYKQVCEENTGHAEVCQITFDNKALSYEDLLSLFFIMHDPTTLNYQEPDDGTRYRSIILYETEAQKSIAERVREESQKQYEKKIVTEIVPLEKFWTAEDYHQNYFNLNENKNPYCSTVVRKKVEKFLKKLKEKEALKK